MNLDSLFAKISYFLLSDIINKTKGRRLIYGNFLYFEQTKTVAAERALRMYMDTMKQNPEQIMRERR